MIRKVRKSNIRDVARKAEVSTATVSRVLNQDRGEVSDTLRRKVHLACEELNYRLNPSIQDLVMSSRSGKTRNLAYVCVGKDFFSNPSNAEGLDGVAHANTDCNYFLSLVHLTGEERSLYDLPPILRDGRVDGMLVSGHLDADIMIPLRKLGIPFIVLGTYNEVVTAGANCIRLNVESTVLRVVQELKNAGKKRIANYTKYPDNFYAQRFNAALRMALKQCELEFDENRMYTFMEGEASPFSQIFTAEELPFDGVVCEDYGSALELAYWSGIRSGKSGINEFIIATSRFSSLYKLPMPTIYFESTSGIQGFRGLKMLDRILNGGEEPEGTVMEVSTNVYLL